MHTRALNYRADQDWKSFSSNESFEVFSDKDKTEKGSTDSLQTWYWHNAHTDQWAFRSGAIESGLWEEFIVSFAEAVGADGKRELYTFI
jgi:hypothetical protein